MTTDNADAIDYERCVAYYRHGRCLADAATIEHHLRRHPGVAERAARDARHDQALAESYQSVLYEPIPPRLLRHHAAPPLTRLGTAASLTAVIGLSAMGGWWLHASLTPTVTTADKTPEPSFGQQVARLSRQQVTQDVAARKTRQSASHPDLSPAGYHFQGRRQVNMDHGTVTAYRYRHQDSKPVTIYSRPQAGKETAAPDVISRSGVSQARWQSGDQTYALTGDLSPEQLGRLADMAARPGDGPAYPEKHAYPPDAGKEEAPRPRQTRDPEADQQPAHQNMQQPAKNSPAPQAARGL